MPGGIAVTPEQLASISAQLSSGAQEVESMLAQLAGVVSPLQTDWQGAAQMQFLELWEQWQRDGNGLLEALLGLAQLTNRAASSYASTEDSVAGSFNQP
ncbi:MAG: hypothetical protein JWM85_3338 [Acidimicrobiaceae bacterium]|nr:hypothetical protein [Acidimicrobiaceae bacterium]